MSGYPPEWALVDELAKSPRPGYPERQGIGTDEVDDWIDKIRRMGIRSIICFLSDDQLLFYSGLPSGLIQYYRDAGFDVAHIPEDDYKTPPLSEEGVRESVISFERLQKPVLVHCSAGIARTGMAIDAILDVTDSTPDPRITAIVQYLARRDDMSDQASLTGVTNDTTESPRSDKKIEQERKDGH